MPAETPETVDVSAAAEILEVGPEQVEAMAAQGMLTPIQGGGGTVFDAAEVRAAKNLGG